MTSKNMKIAITHEQSLNDILRELNRMGFKINKMNKHAKSIATNNGNVFFYMYLLDYNTTIAQLKEMK